ncbi:hypothetical protein PR048_010979, partial [Dryococelus australis]
MKHGNLQDIFNDWFAVLNKAWDVQTTTEHHLIKSTESVGMYWENLIKDDTQLNEEDDEDNDANDTVFQVCDSVVSIERLSYVAVYVAYKHRTIYPDLSVSTEEINEKDRIQTVTKAGLEYRAN